MAETWAEEVQRLRREIAERQARLQHLVLGDPSISASAPAAVIGMCLHVRVMVVRSPSTGYPTPYRQCLDCSANLGPA